MNIEYCRKADFLISERCIKRMSHNDMKFKQEKFLTMLLRFNIYAQSVKKKSAPQLSLSQLIVAK